MEFLRAETLDEALAEAIRTDWRSAPDLSDREHAMLDFTEKLTKSPHKMTSSDTDNLKNAGLTDTEILQTTLIASWFNYINRVADALGVGKP